MAKKKNGLDDFNFDDLDFDSLDAPQSGRRKNNDGPIRKMSQTFGEGAREAMLDPQVVRRFASAALPDGYGTTINVANDISEGVAELYNNAAKELRPAMPAMRRAAGKVADSGKSILPKILRDKLEEFSKEPDVFRMPSREETESNMISQELGTIFASGVQVQAQQHAQSTAERKIRDRVTDRISIMTLKTLNAIRDANERQVAYQDQVTLRYQQKSLELQYRHYFATRQILELHKSNSVRDFEFMQGVLRNTSMSDGAKAASELKEDSRLVNRFKNQFQQSIVKHFGSFGQQIQQNITNSLRSAMGGFSDALTMGDDAASAMRDAQEMGADVSVPGEIGRQLGRATTEGVLRLLANPLRARLGKNKKLTGLGARLNYTAQNLPEHITRWSRTNTDGDSVLSDMINLIKEMVPRKGLDNSLGESSVFTADAPAAYTKRSERTLNEILPGWLMRIHHELLKIRTGNSGVEPVTYNLMRGSFSSADDAKKDILRQVFNPRMVGHARMGLDDFITKQIDPDNKMTKSAREALKRQLFMDTVKGELFDPERFTGESSELTELLGDERSEVAKLIQARFRTGDRDTDSISKDRANTRFVGLRNLLPDTKASMGAWRDMGQKDVLMQSGLIDSIMGHDSINFQRVMEMILKDADGDTSQIEERRSAIDNIRARAEQTIGRAGDAVKDVYANGVDSPVLQAVKMSMGEYRDKATNEIIKTVEDIRGPVMDRFGNVVVTAEQAAAGLRTKGGTLLKRAQTAAQTYLDKLRPAIANLGQRFDQTKRSAVDLAKRCHDIYVTGDYEPVIQATRLQAGEYRDAFTKQVVTTVDEIKGPLIDRYNNVVLTSKDFARGLSDAAGRQMSGLVDRARATTSTLYQQQVETGAIGPASPFDGAATHDQTQQPTITTKNEPSALVQLNAQQVELLTSIHEILATRNFMVGPGEGGPIDEQQRKSWLQRVRNMPKNIKNSLIKGSTRAWGLLGTGIAKASRASWWAVKKGGELYGKYVKGTIGLAGSAVSKVGRGVGSMFGFGTEFFSDIYVKGRKQPALYAKKLSKGEYLDKASGKPIKSIRDIRGEVIEIVDGFPNIVLTQEEYGLGLYDSRGRSLGRFMLQGALGLGKTVLSGYGALIQIPFRLLQGVAKLGAMGVKGFFAQRDIYVPGDDKPRMRSLLMERGEYRSVKTGKQIRKYQDIDGAVWDSKENEVISEDEYKQGLVDVRGRPIATWAERVGGAVVGAGAFVMRQAGRLARGYAQVVGGILGFGKNTLIGFLNGLGGIFNPKVYSAYNDRTTDLLEAIHDLLEKRLPDNGTQRAGSWQSQLKARAELTKSRKGKKDADSEDGKGTGTLSKLFGKGKAGLLGMLGIGGASAEEGSEGSLLDDAGDAANIIDLANGDGGERRGRRRRGKLGKWQRAKALGGKGVGKFKGLLGKLTRGKAGIAAGLLAALGLSAATSGAESTAGNAVNTASNLWSIASLARMTGLMGSAGSAAAGTGGAAATGAVGAAGTAAGGGAAVTLGIPLAIGAAVGYSGFKAHKAYKYGTYLPLRSYRLAQYGVPYTDEDQVKLIVEFEQMVEPYVKGIGGRLDISADGISMEDVYKHFDIDDGWFTNNSNERKQFDTWFNQRFKPVFVSWRNSLNTVKAGCALNDVDESLSGEQKLSLLSTAKAVNRAAYMVMVGPFGEIDITPKEVEEAYTVANHTLEKEKKTGGKSLRDKLERLNAATMRMIPLPFSGYFADVLENQSQGRRLEKANEAKGKTSGGSGGGLGGFIGLKTKSATMSHSLSALDAIRYRTYGLTDLDVEHVRALSSLEADAMTMIRFNREGQGRFEGDLDALFEVYAPIFNINGAKRSDWLQWFENRFLPTLVAFGGAVRRFNSQSDLIEGVKTLKPDQQLVVAQALQSAQREFLMIKMSVWSYTVSPWSDYKLNTDPRTIHDNLQALKEAVKKRLMSEDKGLAAGGKGAKGSASTVNADATARQQKQQSVMERFNSWVFGGKGQKNVLDRTVDGAVNALDKTHQATQHATSGNWSMAGQNAMDAGTSIPRFVAGSAKLANGRNIEGLNLDALWQKVAPLIASGESMGGKYDAQNGVPGNITPGLTGMSIGQVYDLAKSIGRSDGNGPKTGAAGKYQFIPPTLLMAMKQAKLKLTDLFSPENQEKMGRVLFDNRVAAGAKQGVVGILDQLAMEWASLPSPTKGGRSWYHGDSAGNRAHGGQKRLDELIAAVTNTSGTQAGKDPKPSGKPDITNAAVGSAKGPVVAIPSIAQVRSPLPTAKPMLETSTPRANRTADILDTAPGYGSALMAAERSMIPKTAAPRQDPVAQDRVVQSQRMEVEQAARANEIRADMANRDTQRQRESAQEVQSSQLKTQQEMSQTLGAILTTLKTMNGSMISASSSSRESEKTIPVSPTAARSRRPEKSATQLPISMKHRSVS